MTEYDQLCSILSDEFLASSQDVMVEVKEDTLSYTAIGRHI